MPATYYQTVKDRLVGIIQIETSEILAHLDEVAQMDGVDVLFVGPADLSPQLRGFFSSLITPCIGKR